MPLNQIVPTTHLFREGQTAAQRDHARDAGSRPNLNLLLCMPQEFSEGYLYEFDNYIEPSRAHREARA
jgi:hypothetical protein